ncbi:Por secretion system C-terminal sorting domain-containing protein [Lishizhenia tianjinensis]|uniref:Por secretion system C-terminal sorting domain-containing protein n=1 Tax=Lishizhenia tianjinensis TaxID=477690 RepID=A0A1I7B8W5_9FLAO|nr:Por secretion system C-terminal sorting domain-containing protein [Lishizhenia tianjinensis]
MRWKGMALLFWLFSCPLLSQTTVNLYLDTLLTPVGTNYQPGVFYVPKTTAAQQDFLTNGKRQNSIRLHVIESALNNSSNLQDCLQLLDGVQSTLQELANKADKVFFIFEKMPAWLSSSSDGTAATTPGWYVLNTKPPSSYAHWDTMVVAMVNKIVNDFGIDNAYFEFWNEPDLGSWTGTSAEYFKLFQHTYDAVKSVNTNLSVGGAATNFWANNINYQPPYGYVSNARGDSSLIGQLLDSTYAWNKSLDFISWHSFNISYQSNHNAVEYIEQKCNSLGINLPSLVISEWNTQSEVRETPLQKAYFVKHQIALAASPIENNMVAAWQDFEQSTNEFHKDYGLLSYGSIHKPAYKALCLANELKGVHVQYAANAPVDLVVSAHSDTLNVLVSNYIPPALVEAFNHSLFEGKLNVNQFDSAGYIDLTGGDISHLDSIYQGFISVSNNHPVPASINNAIPIYAHFDSLQQVNRQFKLEVLGLTGNHLGRSYRIDNTINNAHHVYDSLIAEGYTQSAAIGIITANQSLAHAPVQLTNGELSFNMQPNAVQLFQFVIPELLKVNEQHADLKLFPNPTHDKLNITGNSILGRIILLDNLGRTLIKEDASTKEFTVDLSSFPAGIYFIRFANHAQSFKVVKR